MSTTALPVDVHEKPEANAPGDQRITVIEPRSAWRFLDWHEVCAYRDLLRFLVWRELKVRYAQSAVGIGWAVIQPVFSMILFSIVFGKLAKVGSDGAPYPLFALAGLVPWTYFSNAVIDGVNSLVNEANTLRKVYFPRMLLPLSSVLAKLVDFTIAMGVLIILLIFYRQVPAPSAFALPLLILIMMAAAAAISLWLTALAVQYRDVKHALTFIIQLAMYATPVVFPASLIPERFRLVFAVNPMVGVIEGFRSSLLGTRPMPWDLVAVGALSTTVVLLTGLVFFHRKERIFADVA